MSTPAQGLLGAQQQQQRQQLYGLAHSHVHGATPAPVSNVMSLGGQSFGGMQPPQQADVPKPAPKRDRTMIVVPVEDATDSVPPMPLRRALKRARIASGVVYTTGNEGKGPVESSNMFAHHTVQQAKRHDAFLRCERVV